MDEAGRGPAAGDIAGGAASADNVWDAVVVGAGFAGLCMLHRLRRLGFSVQVFERGGGVGGTWYWNRYPGARCDVESLEYSCQFSDTLQQEWRWTERYSTQPEILKYANHVADRFDLRPHIRFNTSVITACYDERAHRWQVRTDQGDRTIAAHYLIMASGCLSAPNRPKFAGLDRFQGEILYTGLWPHEEVDFSGKRVGVIGTGSSAIQSIPIIAEQAEQLVVFQRTPNYSVPAQNSPMDADLEQRVKAEYAHFRARNKAMHAGFGSAYPRREDAALEVSEEERQRRYQEYWNRGGLFFMGAFADLVINAGANATAAEFIRAKIRETVKDPETARLLCPDNVVGCKRLCADTNYFATFNRPNVALVDVSNHPIDEFTATGLMIGGVEHRLDCVVFATGFDAMTGALLAIDVRGKGGERLRDKWRSGPRTYLGLTTAGFPNLFMITGPGSPSVLSNMLPSIEQHVDFIADCLSHMRAHQHQAIEAERAAEEGWVEAVNGAAEQTLYPTCNSWYLGANVPGKPRVFMPYLGFPSYVEKCEQVVAKGYDGFAFTTAGGGQSAVEESGIATVDGSAKGS